MKIHTSPTSQKIVEAYNTKPSLSDSIHVLQHLYQINTNLQEQGYLAAHIDSVQWQSDTLRAYVEIGDIFQWVYLRQGERTAKILQQIGYKAHDFQNKTFFYKDLLKLENTIITYAENQGYPFAQTYLDSIQIKENKVAAYLNYTSGPRILFDTLQVYGTLKIKNKFLSKYLKMKKGEVFSQKKVDQSQYLLKKLPFIKLTEPTQVTFKADKAHTQIYANSQKSNQLDGFLGLLPNELEKNKLLITGQFQLKLNNLFNSGKTFQGEFQRLKPTSQLINLQYDHPVLIENIDLALHLNFLKEDTSFVNLNRQITFYYNFAKAGRLSVNAGLRDSRLAFNPENKDVLPAFSDYKYLFYGIGYEWDNLNDFFYPKNGWKISAKSNFGNKEINKNPSLPESFYTNIQLKTLQIETKVETEKYTRIGKNKVLFTKITAAKIINPNLFLNDLYRLGGLTTLRGHNQNFFFASSYALGTLEYRWFFDAQSYFLVFYDQAFYQQKLFNSNKWDKPLGIGAGISFTTQAGIFNLVYALGQDSSQPLNFNRSKVHFGLISRF